MSRLGHLEIGSRVLWMKPADYYGILRYRIEGKVIAMSDGEQFVKVSYRLLPWLPLWRSEWAEADMVFTIKDAP